MTRMNPYLSLAAALIASALLFANGAFAETVLTQVSGDVQIGKGEPAKWTAAQTGDAVAPQDRVRTGADGRVEIKMAAGMVRVHENSMLRLPPAVGDADQVQLDEGRSLFDVLRRKGRRFEVHTPTVVVSVKGTRFGVDAGLDVGEVTVYRGTVGVREVGATEMMETLVREGFLATGGVGVPIELDVSAAPDPWQAWQDTSGAMMDQKREGMNRLGPMDRAKATLHRATAAKVIEKAAQRRPEIAARLFELQKQRRERAAKSDGDSNSPPGKSTPRGDRIAASIESSPAAPVFDSEAVSEIDGNNADSAIQNEAHRMRAIEIRRQALEAREIVDSTRSIDDLNFDERADVSRVSELSSFGANAIRLDFNALYELSPAAVLLVREALIEIKSDYEAGTFVPTSPGDLLTELEAGLISLGLSTTEATLAIDTGIGSLLP